MTFEDTDPGLQLLIDMALENPPEQTDERDLCLLYQSCVGDLSHQFYTDNITQAIAGHFINGCEYRTYNGWTIAFKHTNDSSELTEFANNIREKYRVIETWWSGSVKPEKVPEVIGYIERLLEQQTRH